MVYKKASDNQKYPTLQDWNFEPYLVIRLNCDITNQRSKMGYLALLLGAALAVVANNGTIYREDNNQLWNEFKLKYDKVYENSFVEMSRRAIFEHRLARIEEHNRHQMYLTTAGFMASRSFSTGINHLTDMSPIEYASMNGFKPPKHHERRNNKLDGREVDEFVQKILDDNTIEVPDEIDWRNVTGRVSRVKNQGHCGSCWAFATTGVLEGQEHLRLANLKGSKDIIELSEQNLVDCDTTDAGCEGGSVEDALRFIKSEGGIDDERSYPYKGHQGVCRFKKSNVVLTDRGAAVLPEGDEETLKQVVAKYGPVAVGIDADSELFMSYQQGVYKNEFCKQKLEELDHAVLIVGYGTSEQLGDYWIVKNSWSSMWGEKGYVRMARNQGNMCGIATTATIPKF